MREYQYFIFDLYNTIIQDDANVEREQYHLDTTFSILEKGLYPVKFSELKEKYIEMSRAYDEYHARTGLAFSPFKQVKMWLDSLTVHDVVIFKKVYDSYINAILQINPSLMRNAKKALEYLREQGKKTALISNTGKTPGSILRIMLMELGIYDLFDDMLFSDEVGILKPHPYIFEISVQRLGAVKEDTVFIGDLKHCDYDGALQAGLGAHLFLPQEDDLFQLAVQYTGGY